MHGRKKIHTTDDQKRTKDKIRQHKLTEFTKARDLIYSKVKNDKYDDEGLAVTSLILSKNPDYVSLWNYRRIYFNKLAKDIENDEKLNRLFDEELELSKQCLMTANPKSYSAWFQRFWVLKKMKSPNLDAEIKLCNAALSEDERNFHCWDHRRSVNQLKNVSLQDEISFSDKKLQDNFSNYSSWHYRSTLLPLVEECEGPNIFSLSKKQVEYEIDELLQNAFYTEPSDQSAWFYLEWLLHNRDHDAKELSLDGIVKLPIESSACFVLKFNNAINLCSKKIKLSCPDGTFFDVPSQNVVPLEPQARSSRFWKVLRCGIGDDLGDVSGIQLGNLPDETGDNATSPDLVMSHTPKEAPLLPDDVKELIEKLIGMCMDVLETEKEIGKTAASPNLMALKWPTLCLVKLYTLVNRSNYDEDIIRSLEVLAQNYDPKRRRYYDHLLSSFILGQTGCDLKLDVQMAPKLTDLVKMDRFMNISTLNIDFSNVSSLKSILYLVNLINFSANNCKKLISLDGVQNCELLKEISVKDCCISKSGLIIPFCLSLTRLVKLVLVANPVLNDQVTFVELKSRFGVKLVSEL